MLEQLVTTRISTWGNAVYLHCRNASGTEATIRLTAKQAYDLRTIMPELETVRLPRLHGAVARDVSHRRDA